MTRPLDSNVQSASVASRLVLCAAVKLEMIGGTVYANTSPYTLTINGETYPGVGALGSVGTLEESIELRSFDAALTLSGVAVGDIALALDSGYKNQPGIIYGVFLDTVTHQMVGTPPVIFQGLMDVMTIQIPGDGTCTIQLTLSNRLANWDTARIRRWTDEDQQAEYPGDLGCSFVSTLQDKIVLWGVKAGPNSNGS